MKNTYPYFRFTRNECPKEAAETWFNHFERKGIPAAIAAIYHNSGRISYAVWRAGEEQNSAKPNSERFKGKIVEECHGFFEHLSGKLAANSTED